MEKKQNVEVGTHNTSHVTMPPPKKHLVTDAGFAPHFLAALALEASLCVLVENVPALRWLAADAVSFVEQRLMEGAHALAWWSVIALLASSCCALQVILSAAALGCSGLNSILGPFRPFALATTAALQIGAWHTVVGGDDELLPIPCDVRPRIPTYTVERTT
jgi:hypothetical protein